ncbi:MAG: binding-protein-dependent transport system inner rane component [Actinomycetia bacterium]|nr:binding-protein-dependent transport system inner rane component [Actinomycetes bacterium]
MDVARHNRLVSVASPAAGTAATAAARQSRRRRPGFSLDRWWLRVASPAVAVGLWQLLSATGVLPPSKLVSPASIAHTAYTLVTTNSPTYGTLQASLLVSAERWGIGFALGTAIAVTLAIATGLSKAGELALDPIVHALRSIPLLGIIPLFIVWFGIGELPKILIVVLGALFPMYVNTFAGIRSVDPKLRELGQVLGLTRRELITQIVLPGALPSALTGLRLGVVSSLLALVVGEQINANAGLGFMITTAQEFLQNNIIMVALIVYAILGLLGDTLVRLLERKVLTWRSEFVQ